MDNKEIDLIELIRRFILLIKKYLVFLVIIAVVGAGVGFLKCFLSKQNYKNTVLVKSSIIDNVVINELLKPINYNLKHKPENVYQKIHLDLTDLLKIKEIKLDTNYNEEIIINFFVYDTSGYETIVNKFISYINNHPYVREMMTDEEEMITQYINDIDNELDELNTYQKKIMSSIGKDAGGKMVVNSYNLAYNEMLELMKEKYELSKEKNKIKPVSIISLNMVFDKQISYLKNTVLICIIFIILGLIVIIIKNIK